MRFSFLLRGKQPPLLCAQTLFDKGCTLCRDTRAVEGHCTEMRTVVFRQAVRVTRLLDVPAPERCNTKQAVLVGQKAFHPEHNTAGGSMNFTGGGARERVERPYGAI